MTKKKAATEKKKPHKSLWAHGTCTECSGPTGKQEDHEKPELFTICRPGKVIWDYEIEHVHPACLFNKHPTWEVRHTIVRATLAARGPLKRKSDCCNLCGDFMSGQNTITFHIADMGDENRIFSIHLSCFLGEEERLEPTTVIRKEEKSRDLRPLIEHLAER